MKMRDPKGIIFNKIQNSFWTLSILITVYSTILATIHYLVYVFCVGTPGVECKGYRIIRYNTLDTYIFMLILSAIFLYN